MTCVQRSTIFFLLSFIPILGNGQSSSAPKYPVLDSILSLPDDQLDSATVSNYYGQLFSLYRKGDLASAAHYIQELKPRIIETHVPMYHAFITFEANVLTIRGQYDEAIGKLSESIKYHHNRSDFWQLGTIYGNISSMYSYMENIEATLKNAKLSIEYYVKSGDTSKMSLPIVNIANILSEQKQMDGALQYYYRARAIDSLNNDISGMALIDCNIGIIYTEKNEPEKGLPFLLKSFKLDSTLGDTSELVGTHQYLGEAYRQLREYGKASYHLNRSLELSKKTGVATARRETYRSLIELSLLQGNVKKGTEFIQEHADFIDTMFNEEKASALASAETVFKQKEIELENQLIKAESELVAQRKNRQLWIFSSVTIVGTFLLIFVWLGARRQKRLNEQMEERQKQLELSYKQLNRLMKEKDDLMSIVAHDLMSPFTGLSGLCYILGHEEPGDLTKDQLDIIRMMEQLTAGGISLIKDITSLKQLEENSDLEMEPSVSISQLLSEVVSEFKPLAKTKHQKLETEIEESVEAQTVREHLARIARNLISNAIKYSPKYASIKVILSQKDTQFTVCVIDEGPGFSERDKQAMFNKFTKLSARPTGNEHSTGLGLYTVKMLVKKLHGKLDLKTQVGLGSEFILTFEKTY